MVCPRFDYAKETRKSLFVCLRNALSVMLTCKAAKYAVYTRTFMWEPFVQSVIFNRMPNPNNHFERGFYFPPPESYVMWPEKLMSQRTVIEVVKSKLVFCGKSSMGHCRCVIFDHDVPIMWPSDHICEASLGNRLAYRESSGILSVIYLLPVPQPTQ